MISGFGIFGGVPAAVAAAPNIEYLYPAGASQGATLEITIGGRSLDGANEVWVSGNGVTGRVLEVNQPTEKQIREAQQLDAIASQTARIRLTIDPNAPEGVRDLRIMAEDGLSNRFRFEIGALPEITETEPNNSFADAQTLPSLPLVVNGQITNADRDFFRFHARAGQNLVLEVKARAIKPYLADGVPPWFQARLAIYDNTGRKLDEQGYFRFDPDPVMFFKVPADGDYTIEIWDALSRGRDDLVYRIKIGEFPYLTDIFPLGGSVANQQQRITARGVNLPGTTANWRFDLSSQQPGIIPVGFKLKNGAATNRRPFEVSEQPEITEREPNNAPYQAQRVATPVIVNGRIDAPGDVDMYAFTAKAGDKLVFDVMARRLGSPLDAKITLGPQRQFYNKPTTIDDVKDERYGLVTHHADPRLAHTFKTDGAYIIAIEDTQGQGGPEYAYRLSIAPQQPDFELRLMPDNLSVPAGGNVVVQLKAMRIDGYDGPIRLHTEGLPPGFNLAGAEIAEGKNQTILTLAAPLNIRPGVYKPRFWAEAEIDGKTVKHNVNAAEELMQAFAYYHTVAVEQGYLVVTPASPFRVELARDPADTGPIELVLGKETEIPVRIIRNPQAIAALQQNLSRQQAAGTARNPANAAKDGGKNTTSKTPNANAKPTAQTNKPTPKNTNIPPNVAKANQAKQQQAAIAQLPIRVIATRGGRGMIVEAAVIESGTTEGVIKVRCTNAGMVGQEGVFIIEGTIRPRGKKISSLAPALPFKVLPAEDGEPVVRARNPEEKSAQKKKNAK